MRHSDFQTGPKGQTYVFQLWENEIAFPVRRMFLIRGIKDVPRGGHAHKNCWQMLMVVSGKWEVRTIYKGKVHTRNPQAFSGDALIMKPLTWVELVPLTDGASIVVLCDKEYDPADYIHDRKEFEELCKRQHP